MSHLLRTIHFPYCLQQRKDKRWVPVNRNYKPLGQPDLAWSDYDALPVESCIARITPAQAKRLSYDGSSHNRGAIYLYNDGCIPEDGKESMDAYLARLAVLMKLKTAK